MRLDQLLEEKRGEILRIAAEHGAREVRVFGSVARGEADRESDLDFLVELETGRSLLDLGGLQMGTRIPARSPGGCRDRTRPQGAYSRARAAGSGSRVRTPKNVCSTSWTLPPPLSAIPVGTNWPSSATSSCRCGSFGTCRSSARRPGLYLHLSRCLVKLESQPEIVWDWHEEERSG